MERTEPKRPLNAYLLFMRDKRSAVKEQHPELKAKSIVSFIAKMWNECAEKEKYQEEAERHKEEYRKQVEEHGPPKQKRKRTKTPGPEGGKKRRTKYLQRTEVPS